MLKLTCWVRGTNPSTLGRKEARSRQKLTDLCYQPGLARSHVEKRCSTLGPTQSRIPPSMLQFTKINPHLRDHNASKLVHTSSETSIQIAYRRILKVPPPPLSPSLSLPLYHSHTLALVLWGTSDVAVEWPHRHQPVLRARQPACGFKLQHITRRPHLASHLRSVNPSPATTICAARKGS